MRAHGTATYAQKNDRPNISTKTIQQKQRETRRKTKRPRDNTGVLLGSPSRKTMTPNTMGADRALATQDGHDEISPHTINQATGKESLRHPRKTVRLWDVPPVVHASNTEHKERPRATTSRTLEYCAELVLLQPNRPRRALHQRGDQTQIPRPGIVSIHSPDRGHLRGNRPRSATPSIVARDRAGTPGPIETSNRERDPKGGRAAKAPPRRAVRTRPRRGRLRSPIGFHSLVSPAHSLPPTSLRETVHPEPARQGHCYAGSCPWLTRRNRPWLPQPSPPALRHGRLKPPLRISNTCGIQRIRILGPALNMNASNSSFSGPR